MRTVFWLGTVALLLMATPARAGEDFADTLENWPAWESRTTRTEPVVADTTIETIPAEKAETRSPWHFQLTFYLWATSLDSTSTIDGIVTDVELGFSDIFDELLEGAFSGRFEAWNGDFGLVLNFDWIDLGKGLEITGPGPLGRSLNFDVQVEQYDVFLGAAWRFTGPSAAVVPVEKGFFGDLYAGARYTSLKQEVDVKGDLRRRKLGGKESWVEPVIGVRLGYHVNDWLTLAARGDAGGFGWSDRPDRDVILLAGAEFRPARWLGLRIGYQWRWFDYSTGSGRDEFGLEADYGGPWLGVTFQF